MKIIWPLLLIEFVLLSFVYIETSFEILGAIEETPGTVTMGP